MDDLWDCIIVGGGAAGLSAALVLGRARQRTLLIDAGAQSNLPAEGVGGLLGHDGLPPEALYEAAHRELAAYPTVEVRQGEVVSGSRLEGRIDLRLLDGPQCSTRRVLLATGMDYQRPVLDGVDLRWGRSVFHCPFCHGWEVRDRHLGVLDSGESGVRRAFLLREWSNSVTLYSHGPTGLDDADAGRLRVAGVTVDDRRVVELCGPGASLTAVRFADGAERICEGLLVPVTLKQRSPLAAQLGVELADPGPVAFDAVRVDAMNRTSVPEVYAAGDATTMPSVANAVASGSVAAAMMVHDLVAGAPPPREGSVTEDRHHADDAATFWDAHYARHAEVWSGAPNSVLVDETSGLRPGTALDLGCGEGADAVWLALQGWHVTGVDVSQVALERASRRADATGVAAEVTWERHDLDGSFPAGTFDLVTAHYLHSPLPARRAVALQQAARAVAPGGTLLVVGHASVAPWSWDQHAELPTASQVLDELGIGGDNTWHVAVCEDRPRQATGPSGQVATVTDSVCCASPEPGRTGRTRAAHRPEAR